MATPKRQRKSPSHRGPGRPSQGIHSGYARLDVYVPTHVRDGLDRQQQKTGETTVRADVIREALVAYLREHSPEAGD